MPTRIRVSKIKNWQRNLASMRTKGRHKSNPFHTPSCSRMAASTSAAELHLHSDRRATKSKASVNPR